MLLVVPRGKFDSTNHKHDPDLGSVASSVLGIFRYFYIFATQLHYLKMPKKKKKNVGRDGEEA